MNKVILGLSLVFLVSGLALAEGLNVRINDDVFRIEAGSRKSDKATIRELQDRIYDLERAVAQLQDRVFRLAERPQNVPARKVSCYLKNTFNTFTASGATENEARGKALKACTEKHSSMFCDEDDVKCDQG